MYFIKENGNKVKFDKSKIKKAIIAAMRDGGVYLPDIARLVAHDAEKHFSKISNNEESFSVTRSQIDKYIFDRLIHYGQNLTAQSYEDFKTLRKYQKQVMDTDDAILSLINGKNEELQMENSNKTTTLASTQRDLIAGEISKSLARRKMIPAHLIHAHDLGLIHIHDLDYYTQPIFNCDLINLQDMLDNGTVINNVLIESPHSFKTACTIATQIVAQVSSCQYGGQTISTSHLAPYVRKSFNKYKQKYLSRKMSEKQAEKWATVDTKEEVKDGVQTIQYQLNTLMTTNGQSPFLSVAMWISERPEYEKENALIIEEILKQRYIGVKDQEGHYVTPAFPKLLYFTDDNNIYETSKYFYITELAAKCSAKRLVPDYISTKVMRNNVCDAFPCMGCRSFLSQWYDENGKPKYYGRFNLGVVSINLADAGLSAEKDLDLFWSIMEERLSLCKEALLLRIEKIKGTTTEIAPILWEHGAIARLPKGSKIDSLLENGYATISLGYHALYECVQALIGKSHTTEEGQKLAVKIMQFLRDKVDEWKAETGYGFGLYGSPAESLTYKFARTTKNRFGEIPKITDRLYLTNSYHVHVSEPIDAFSKLKFESQFQKLSSGGCISYVEVPNLNDNIPAVIQLIQFIHENIQYAEINTKSDLCENCGFDGEILIDKEKMDWYCPQCGCTDKNKLHVTRRTCGYIGSSFWNKGKTQEIGERVIHLD
jgi:ribonucleoside-triphosphate reductase